MNNSLRVCKSSCADNIYLIKMVNADATIIVISKTRINTTANTYPFCFLFFIN